MATYFHDPPEIQQECLQTLYLMNPGFVGGYPEVSAAVPSGMLLLNPTMGSFNPMNLTHSAHVQNLHQHFVGIPLQTPAATAMATLQDSPVVHSAQDVSAVPGLAAPRLHYNLWHQQPPSSSNSIDVALSQFGQQRASAMTPAQRTLSLSLSPRKLSGPATEFGGPAGITNDQVKMMAASSSSASGTSNSGAAGLQTLLMGSKYLKATQELLDEVVKVDKDIKAESTKNKNLMKRSRDSGSPAEEEMNMKHGGSGGGGGRDLSTAERQELQMKKAKLVGMIDEVEHRYRQYHHQMQIVVSSFEAVAGYGSARTYTALALQTISKQFRCLRDAITSQIRATSKSLGEEEPMSGSSRLRFVDHHLRQQRALQQLGMIQHNAWRPQRGLPERSVSILRAWLFEHFLHPYPKDSDKLILAKQTGLTRSQVSNWFINARVRLWKPMVEEMYAEEVKDQEQKNADENASKSDAAIGSATPKSSPQVNNNSPKSSAELSDGLENDAKQPSGAVQQSSLVNGLKQGIYYDNEAFVHPNLKKSRPNESLTMNPVPPSIRVETKQDEASNQELLLKFMDRGQSIAIQGYPLMPSNMNTRSGGGGYGGYTIGDLGRFDTEEYTPRFAGNGGSISLTLGLQHSENHSLSLSGKQPSSFQPNQNMAMARRLEMNSEANDFCGLSNTNATATHPSGGYESITIQDGKRFAAAQLLPYFVA